MSASELQKAVDKLIKREPRWVEATQPPAKGAKPGKVATGYPASAGRGQNIVLEETDYALRQHWPPFEIISTDGMFVIEIEPIKYIDLGGGDGFKFAEPT